MLLFISLILFFIDILSFILFKSWMLFSVSLFFLFINFYFDKKSYFINCFLIFFILLQDYLILGRVGISLFYTLPIIFFSKKLRNTFNLSWGLVLLIFISVLDVFLLKYLFLDQNIWTYSTFYSFLINIIVGYLIFLGMLGNRSWF